MNVGEMDVAMVDVSRAVIRRPQPVQGAEDDKRVPDFTVRARAGSGARDWIRVGSAWKGQDNDGFEIITVALSALPIAVNNRVTLKLLVPFEEAKPETADAPNHTDEAVPMPETTEGFGRRRRVKETEPAVGT